MIKEHNLTDLFKKFIKASETGQRLKKNGQRINISTVKNYYNTLRLLENFATKSCSTLLLHELKGNNKREFQHVKKQAAGFYKKFCTYLFQHLKVINNYAGQNIKIIRTFYNWCLNEKGIAVGNFHKSFYVLNEEIPVITLSIEQLNFLIHDTAFTASLKPYLQKAKEVFIVGCVVGLRISDLKRLQKQHIFFRDGYTYLRICTQKTGYETMIKLPPFAVDIIKKYEGKFKKNLLPITINSRFNKSIKVICEQAGWTAEMPKERMVGNKKTIVKHNTNASKQYRFCDLISSHTMRRTCITNMLTAGMPEHVVRKISGHTSDSKSFFRYVALAQKLADTEIDKLFNKLLPSEKNAE
jgi:integrase